MCVCVCLSVCLSAVFEVQTYVYLTVLFPSSTCVGREVSLSVLSALISRLVTSISKLALGPLPCQPSPGGDAFGAQDLGGVRVTTGVKQGDSGQRSKLAGLMN